MACIFVNQSHRTWYGRGGIFGNYMEYVTEKVLKKTEICQTDEKTIPAMSTMYPKPKLLFKFGRKQLQKIISFHIQIKDYFSDIISFSQEALPVRALFEFVCCCFK